MVLSRSTAPRWRWWAAWGLLAVASAALLALLDLQRQHDVFETHARIAHRLLSQRAAQHDTMLATLGLLAPGSAAAGAWAPAARLPALYPQVLAVHSRAPGAAWPDTAFATAELAARTAGHPVLAQFDGNAGRAVLVAGAGTAAHALVLDLRAMVPADEWPLPPDTPTVAELRLDGQRWLVPAVGARPSAGKAATAAATANAGRAAASGGAVQPQPQPQPQPQRHSTSGFWTFSATKRLASASQPFDLVVYRQLAWAAIPWARMAAAALAWAAVLAGAAAWLRQAHHRRRAEELLRLGQVGRLNALGELAAGMAHELNQPLTAVLSATQAAQRLLADDPPELDTARQAMAHAAAQARRASEVLTRLRRCVERPDAAEAIVPLDLAAAARDALDLLAPELLRHGVVARVAATAGVQVLAEPVAVQQIVHNLVLNALQAMSDLPAAQRRIDLVVEPQTGQGLLRLGDSGPGIAAEVLPRLFEPFFSTRRGGLGLGLAMCETLAQRLSGTLTAANRSTGGAVFTLALPLVPA